MSETMIAGLILSAIISVIMAVACVPIAILGCKMLNKLAHHPSQTPMIQTSILIPLVIVEVVSITALLIFYHVLADYKKEDVKGGIKTYERNVDIAVLSSDGHSDRRDNLLFA